MWYIYNKLCGRCSGWHGMPPPACSNPTSQAFVSGHDWPWQLKHMLQLPWPTKFEVRRRHTFGFSINRPGDLSIWPFHLEPGTRYCPWCGQPSCQFWCLWDFSFSTYGPTPVRRTTWPWPLTLEVAALVGDTGLRVASMHQVCMPSHSEDMTHFCISISWPSNLG